MFGEDIIVQKIVGHVYISKSGIRKSFGHSTNDAKLDVVPHLQKILEQAEYLDTLDDFDGKDIRYHYFATRIIHGGQKKMVYQILCCGGVTLRENLQQGAHKTSSSADVLAAVEISGVPAAEARSNKSVISSLLNNIYSVNYADVSKV